jgi:hypothetical protein
MPPSLVFCCHVRICSHLLENRLLAPWRAHIESELGTEANGLGFLSPSPIWKRGHSFRSLVRHLVFFDLRWNSEWLL